jgi:hypothetical protein
MNKIAYLIKEAIISQIAAKQKKRRRCGLLEMLAASSGPLMNRDHARLYAERV